MAPSSTTPPSRKKTPKAANKKKNTPPGVNLIWPEDGSAPYQLDEFQDSCPKQLMKQVQLPDDSKTVHDYYKTLSNAVTRDMNDKAQFSYSKDRGFCVGIPQNGKVFFTYKPQSIDYLKKYLIKKTVWLKDGTRQSLNQPAKVHDHHSYLFWVAQAIFYGVAISLHQADIKVAMQKAAVADELEIPERIKNIRITLKRQFDQENGGSDDASDGDISVKSESAEEEKPKKKRKARRPPVPASKPANPDGATADGEHDSEQEGAYSDFGGFGDDDGESYNRDCESPDDADDENSDGEEHTNEQDEDEETPESIDKRYELRRRRDAHEEDSEDDDEKGKDDKEISSEESSSDDESSSRKSKGLSDADKNNALDIDQLNLGEEIDEGTMVDDPPASDSGISGEGRSDRVRVSATHGNHGSRVPKFRVVIPLRSQSRQPSSLGLSSASSSLRSSAQSHNTSSPNMSNESDPEGGESSDENEFHTPQSRASSCSLPDLDELIGRQNLTSPTPRQRDSSILPQMVNDTVTDGLSKARNNKPHLNLSQQTDGQNSRQNSDSSNESLLTGLEKAIDDGLSSTPNQPLPDLNGTKQSAKRGAGHATFQRMLNSVSASRKSLSKPVQTTTCRVDLPIPVRKPLKPFTPGTKVSPPPFNPSPPPLGSSSKTAVPLAPRPTLRSSSAQPQSSGAPLLLAGIISPAVGHVPASASASTLKLRQPQKNPNRAPFGWRPKPHPLATKKLAELKSHLPGMFINDNELPLCLERNSYDVEMALNEFVDDNNMIDMEQSLATKPTKQNLGTEFDQDLQAAIALSLAKGDDDHAGTVDPWDHLEQVQKQGGGVSSSSTTNMVADTGPKTHVAEGNPYTPVAGGRRLYIGNIPKDATKAEVKRLFDRYDM